MVQLLSEQNLWRLIKEEDETSLEVGQSVEAHAMMMIYVDDIFSLWAPPAC